MDWNVLDEYLVQIGADIDQNSFNSAKGALNELKRHLASLQKAAAPLALAAAIGAIGKAAYETIKSVAMADMEYKKLAASMWTTKETAKALSVAMKTMGVSQDDIAWVPELREQFFRLRAEMQKFATPADADAQLRYIREIGYDIQALFVRLKMLKEWIAYYLIKYLEPYIKEFKAFINWLLDKLGEDLPGLARKVARAMTNVLSPAIQTVKAFGMVLGKIYDFIVNLPENVKKWGAIFAAVGAVILAGPFGRMLMALSAAMLLIEDFMFYLNGWNSSKTLAPVWEALIKFSEGTGSEWMTGFTKVLTEIADILERIFKGINLTKCLQEADRAVTSLGNGISNLLKSFRKMFKSLDDGKPKVRSFWDLFGDAIGTVIRLMFRLIGTLGGLIDAVSSYMDGDRSGGQKKIRRAFGYLLGNEEIADFNGVGTSMEESKKYFTANDGVPLDTLAPEARAGFAALMKDIHTSTGGQQTWLTATTNGKHMEGSDHYKGIAIDLVNDAFKDEAFRKAYIKKIEALGYHVYDEYDRANWTSDTTGEHLHIRLNGYKEPEIKKSLYDAYQEKNKKPAVNDSATGGWAERVLGNSSGFMPGSNEMATDLFRGSYGFDFLRGGQLIPAAAGGGFGGGISLGAPTVNINVNSTNATAEEIGAAARSGVEQGMNPALHVAQRMMRGGFR